VHAASAEAKLGHYLYGDQPLVRLRSSHAPAFMHGEVCRTLRYKEKVDAANYPAILAQRADAAIAAKVALLI
jgi:hypothetical protein